MLMYSYPETHMNKSCTRTKDNATIWPIISWTKIGYKRVLLKTIPYLFSSIRYNHSWDPAKNKQEPAILKQNTRLQHDLVCYTVKALESLCVCLVLVCASVGGIGPRQSALPAFCPLVFSLLMDGPCSAPSGYGILHINHHKHKHIHTLLSHKPDELSTYIWTHKKTNWQIIMLFFNVERQTERKENGEKIPIIKDNQ